MAYAVKAIFLTLQGEGMQCGRPAVFLRMSGCNLWNGRESDRDQGAGSCAHWCDTDFFGTDGPDGGRYADPGTLADAVAGHWRGNGGMPLVVCTGGEPLLQLDPPLIAALHTRGFQIAIETNGTLPVPEGIDWVCVSPKAGSALQARKGDELKVIFPQPDLDLDALARLQFRHFLLQPMDGPEREANTHAALQYCLEHPHWRLSLQTHKFLGIP